MQYPQNTWFSIWNYPIYLNSSYLIISNTNFELTVYFHTVKQKKIFYGALQIRTNA